MDLIKLYKDKGQLEIFKIEHAQISKYIEAAYQDLKEVRITFPVSDKAAYLFAYTAMLKMGRALLFLKGFRSKGKGQHETVIEIAGDILGKGFTDLTNDFDAMRRKRNKMIYDVGDLISHSDAEGAFRTAEQYLNKVKDFMKKEDSQLRFEL
ncbi:MAG: hypothetical protein HYS07_03515 [Chlamydiae bacterium]|nr:hypothetical protein [Chlamydiota bacterium]MBI3276757.1 hypothetical protein [Chlamydiota bacterium]